MEQVLIGTSGYSYDDWIGPVYPAGTQKKDFLSIYASEFSMVELNFSYYTQPRASMLERMIQNTPDNFLFSIKGHKSLTHEINEDNRSEAAQFMQGIQPLVESSRLAAVLLQFPYRFHYTPDSRRYLNHICRLLEGLPLAVEFRNDEWFNESVYEAFKERSIALVNVDTPELPKLPKTTAEATSDMAYIRFHGRNRKQWWKGDRTSRYDYLYSEEELSGWIDRVMLLVRKTKLLLIAFNNHYRGQAVSNARMLKDLLKGKIPVR